MKTEDLVNLREINSYILFNVARERLCLNLSLVKEVIEVKHIKPFPRASRKFEGIHNLRGEIIPVLNLNETLGLQEYTGARTGETAEIKVLVIEHPYEKFGMVVDQVYEIITLSEQILESVPDSVETEIPIDFIENVGAVDDQPVIFLDLHRIIEDIFVQAPIERPEYQGMSLQEDALELIEQGGTGGIPTSLSIDLTPAQQDALVELANIASGSSMTALSELLKTKKKIDLYVSEVEIVKIGDIPEIFGGAQNRAFMVKSEIKKSLQATNFLIFPYAGMAELLSQIADLSLKKEGIKELSDLGKDEQSAIEEIGNIISAHYISAISDFLNLKLYKEAPVLGFDMLGSLIDTFLVEQSQFLSELVCLHTQISVAKLEIEGAFLFVPHKASIKKFLKNLTVDHVVDAMGDKTKAKPKKAGTKTAKKKATKKKSTKKKSSKKKTTKKKSVTIKSKKKKASKRKKPPAKKQGKLEFTEEDMDTFRELGNIGAGHAGNALSQMINKKVMLDIPETRLLSVSQIKDQFKKVGDYITGSFSTVKKSVDANILLMFPVEHMERLFQIVLELDKPKKLPRSGNLGESDQSVIMELSSILIGHYIAALSNFLHLPIDPPEHNYYFEKLENFFKKLEQGSQKDVISMVIETRMEVVGTDPILGYFVMIPNTLNLKKILARIKEIWET